MLESIQALLLRAGLQEGGALLVVTSQTIAAVLVGCAALAGFLIAKSPVSRLAEVLAAKTRSRWDDALLQHHVLRRLTGLVPCLLVYILTPYAFEPGSAAIGFVRNLSLIAMLVVGAAAVSAFAKAFLEIYSQYEISREMHIKGVVQVLLVAAYLIVVILIISILVGKTPLYMLSGIGAMTAVLMLVFKDAILGFVAGIQLTANRMVAIGDWIEMPKYGANGDVIEVALTTVKVQNWDKTITTIPTYALITDAFKNWRGMTTSGGRRIKRALCIDMKTIRFLTHDDLEAMRRIQYIADYIDAKREEVDAYNRDHNVDENCVVNGRRLTNIGTFRAYVSAYLRNHPKVNQEMTFLVRQLDPGPQGLPIEIYVFSSDQAWADYEAIQADIFDHILAVVPEFRLRVYQNPSGHDVEALSTQLTGAA